MKSYTQKGLMLLMISIIISIIASIILYFSWSTIDIESTSVESLMNILIAIIPGLIIAAIGGVLSLIGAILIFMGRNEFGEKHAKYINYALIIILISIGVSVISGVVSSFMQYSSQSSIIFENQDTTAFIESFRTSTIVSSITTAIVSMISGLVWVFGLYNLENDTGKKILIAAYISVVAVAIITAFSMMMFYDELIDSDLFQETINSSTSSSTLSTSQLLSSLSNLGNTLLIGMIGGAINSALFFFAVYIPYNRIQSGELTQVVSDQYGNQKRCMGCGRIVPSDSRICAYCGKELP